MAMRSIYVSDVVKFIYSEKATKICEIFTSILSYVVPVKNKVKISQNAVAHSSLLSVFGLNATSTYDSYLPLIFGKFALI